jgi:hypothetical protein
MSDSPSSRDFISQEVTRQIQPIGSAVLEVKKQNAEQSTIIAMQVRKIEEIGNRLRALYGNGTGPPGYLEVARKEDKEKIDRLFSMVDDLTAEKLRSEGAAAALREIDAKKSRRLMVWQRWATGLGIPAGAWLFTLFRPLLHALIVHLAKSIQQ